MSFSDRMEGILVTCPPQLSQDRRQETPCVLAQESRCVKIANQKMRPKLANPSQHAAELENAGALERVIQMRDKWAQSFGRARRKGRPEKRALLAAW